jgi:phospholipase C
MLKKQLLRSVSSSLVALGLLLQAPVAFASGVTIGPKSSAEVAAVTIDPSTEPTLTPAQKIALLQQKVKYVFVLFQENRSFDFHFGTFPGVNGTFSQAPSATPGFNQPIVNTDGTVTTVTPFLIPRLLRNIDGKPVPLYPEDTDSVDHSHTGIDNSIDLDATGTAKNDRFALNEEGYTTNGSGQIVTKSGGLSPSASPPTLAQKQKGELVMAHIDCDTIPFLWRYADRFTIFDNFHMTINGPSSPNAIAMIAGQSGDTQWVLHPDEADGTTKNAGGGVPQVGDSGPFAGSNLDTSKFASKPPYGPNDESPVTPALNQTSASLPLSFMGPEINNIIASDKDPTLDLMDVQDDIKTIASQNLKQVQWGWYQEGYDHEPTDGTGPATFDNYITHHNGPQYFGYVGDNPQETKHLHGLGDFFTDIQAGAISKKPGVYYVRGGYGNNDGLKPLDPNPKVQSAFPGNDDHPGYSDAQISEALLADEVNAIVNSPYWKDAAIVITYDETDGLYDHAAFKPRTVDPTGGPLDGGSRIPAIVISPYAVAHGIVSDYAEHSSVIKFIDELFNLVPLGDLPDEAKALTLGVTELGQSNLGPADTLAGLSDLTEAFDNGRLSGTTPVLNRSYALIPTSTVLSLPHYNGNGCHALSITPTDYVNGVPTDLPPADFNPRPSTTPGTPSSGTWTP